MKLKELGILLTINLLILISAAAQNPNFEGITSVKVSFNDALNKLPVSATIAHSFPMWDVSVIADTISETKKEIWLRCPVRTLQEGDIFIEDKKLHLLMRPGDTIYVSLRGSHHSPKVEVSGKTREIQEYYMDRTMRFPIPVSQLIMNAGVTSANLQQFKNQADSLYSLDQQFWNGYKQKHSFPEWFIRYETDAILYRNAQLRMYTLVYQTLMQPRPGGIPNGFFDFLKTLPFRNEAAMNDYYYLHFLHEYLRHKAGAGTGNFDQNLEFKMAKELLGDKIGDFYILFSISNYLITDPAKVKTDLSKLSHTTPSEYLVNYLRDRADASMSTLKPGDSAPEFFLEDKLDSLISLSQFKGHVVYLSFWFPGCKGCIHEFPFENALVDKFKSKPVKIINVCTRAKKSQWIATVEKYDLQTLNLYANTSWQNKLEDKYAIKVYPHYVLIGGDGRVIENFAARPSEVSKDIEKAVKDLMGK